MKRVFNIQIQRADNGFIAIAQHDTGIKTKKVVATSEEDVQKAAKDFIDRMFDEPTEKSSEPEKKE